MSTPHKPKDLILPVRLAELAPRQRQLVEAMATGLIAKQAAYLLSISPRTVDAMATQIKQAFGLEDSRWITILRHFYSLEPKGSVVLGR